MGSMVSFPPQPLYAQGKRPSARINGLGRPQRWYAYFGEETNFLSLPERETIFRTSSSVLTTTPTVQLDPSNGEAKNEWRQTSIPHTPSWCRPTQGQRYFFVYLSCRTEDAAALTQTTVTEYNTDPITYNTCRHNTHLYSISKIQFNVITRIPNW
jgi:hypothetical protein